MLLSQFVSLARIFIARVHTFWCFRGLKYGPYNLWLRHEKCYKIPNNRKQRKNCILTIIHALNCPCQEQLKCTKRENCKKQYHKKAKLSLSLDCISLLYHLIEIAVCCCAPSCTRFLHSTIKINVVSPFIHLLISRLECKKMFKLVIFFHRPSQKLYRMSSPASTVHIVCLLKRMFHQLFQIHVQTS